LYEKCGLTELPTSHRDDGYPRFIDCLLFLGWKIATNPMAPQEELLQFQSARHAEEACAAIAAAQHRQSTENTTRSSDGNAGGASK
jgi:hypothetical protein